MGCHYPLYLFFVCFLVGQIYVTCQFASMPSQGIATVTHYANNGVGACNCRGRAHNYPTAALNEYYFGASPGGGSGKGCGKCYKIKIFADGVNPSSWCNDNAPELVVKVTNLCPRNPDREWCGGGPQNNDHNSIAHFDLDSAHVGRLTSFSGRGAWRAQYCEVPCSQWAGYHDSQASGTNDNTWGSCPRDASTQGNCNFAKRCSSPPPSGGGGSGACNSIAFMSTTNAWWVALGTKASSVQIDCGWGYLAMRKVSWNHPTSGDPVWETINLPKMCASRVNVKIGGTVCSNLVRPGA